MAKSEEKFAKRSGAGLGRTSPITGNKPSGQGTTSTPSAPGDTVSIPTVDRALGEEGIVAGKVNAYSVDAERLMIKLDVGAVDRRLVTMSCDEPHFRTAVSMTMMAHHTPNTRLTVRYFKPVHPQLSQQLYWAKEIAIGNEPGEAMDFDSWPRHL